MVYYILIFIIVFIIAYLQGILNNKKNKIENKYYKKQFMTECELNFYNKIKILEDENYKIVPQVNLATIITKSNNKYHG